VQLHLAIKEIGTMITTAGPNDDYYSWPAGAHSVAYVPLKHQIPEFNVCALAGLLVQDPVVFVTSHGPHSPHSKEDFFNK